LRFASLAFPKSFVLPRILLTPWFKKFSHDMTFVTGGLASPRRFHCPPADNPDFQMPSSDPPSPVRSRAPLAPHPASARTPHSPPRPASSAGSSVTTEFPQGPGQPSEPPVLEGRCAVHFQLEVLESRIHLGIDQLPEFNPDRLSDSERRKQAHYTEKASKEVCPTFWEPRPWDREEDRMSEADSNALRDRISNTEASVGPAVGEAPPENESLFLAN
jgi:hypothetical protein